MRTLYFAAPRSSLIDRRTQPIIKVEGYEHDTEKHWVVPQLRQVLLEGQQVFLTYEEARSYQNKMIEQLILNLRARQSDLNDCIEDVEVTSA